MTSSCLSFKPNVSVGMDFISADVLSAFLAVPLEAVARWAVALPAAAREFVACDASGRFLGVHRDLLPCAKGALSSLAVCWRDHSESPDVEGVTAVMALMDLDGRSFLLPGLFEWVEGEWRGAADSVPLIHEVYFWMPEAVLTDCLGSGVAL